MVVELLQSTAVAAVLGDGIAWNVGFGVAVAHTLEINVVAHVVVVRAHDLAFVVATVVGFELDIVVLANETAVAIVEYCDGRIAGNYCRFGLSCRARCCR